MKFREVQQAVRAWFDTVTCKQGIRVDVVRSDDGGFRVFFESADKMGELIVAQPDFAPFRFVSFQILRTDEVPVFCYYDSDGSSVSEILAQLDVGLKMM